jgi:tetratricopeptide (TPR) repeat protein
VETLRESEYNRGTGCGKTARPGLCGGCRVTGVPTARDVLQHMSMNTFRKILSYVPTMIAYLRGCRMFQEGNYTNAVINFEKCLQHPKFNDELIFSYYGQALCAAGRAEKGLNYLLKACKGYDNEGWIFRDEFTYNLAKNTIDALKHTNEQLGSKIGREYLDKEMFLKR